MKHFFDRTLLFFVLSLILIGALIYCSIPRNKPAGIRVAAIQSTRLSAYKEPFATINQGDSLTILGADFSNLRFLAATDDGQRGWIPQEAVDNKGIIYKVDLITDNGKTAVNSGDTVTLLARTGDEYAQMMKFKAANGEQGEVRVHKLTTSIGNNVRKYEYKSGNYYLSKKKFEEKYIGKTFQENENLYRPAFLIKKTKNGLEAQYDLRVFDKNDGRFYTVIITYQDGVAVSYSSKIYKSPNRLFLKYLPLVSTIIDVDFFSQLISTNAFEIEDFDAEDRSVILKISGYVLVIFFILGIVGYFFFFNQTIPFLLFGLLRFRYPLIFISNKLFPKIIVAITFITTYIWLVLGLCFPMHWWYFIPALLIATWWLTPKILDWFTDFPSNRCPDCKSLYTIEYYGEEFVREYQEWRKKTDSKKIGSRSNSEWVHDTEVTKWSDGRTTSRMVNQRKVTHTTSTYNNDVYDVLYLVRVYKLTYKCEHCGLEEYGSRSESKELDRKYQGSYVDSTTTHSGY